MSFFYDLLKSAVGVFDYSTSRAVEYVTEVHGTQVYSTGTVGEFVVWEGDELVESGSLRKKNKLSYASIVIHGREYDITDQVRKFVLYFFKSTTRARPTWNTVLEYCANGYEDIYNENSKVVLILNDDSMTEVHLQTNDIRDFLFHVDYKERDCETITEEFEDGSASDINVIGKLVGEKMVGERE